MLWVEQDGRTLLHVASDKGHLEVCKWLVTVSDSLSVVVMPLRQKMWVDVDM